MNRRTNRARVLIIHNFVTPYRAPLFEDLGESYDVDVLYCRARASDRLWQTTDETMNYSGTVLPSVSLGFLVLNPTIAWQLWRRRPDVVVLADNDENALTGVAAALYCRVWRIPLIVWNEHVSTGHLMSPRSARVGALLDSGRVVYRRLLYPRAAAFLSMSGPDTDTFLTARGADPARIFTGTQIMPAQLLPAPESAAHAPAEYLLFLGYHRAEKGVDLLIRAFRDGGPHIARLLIAGTGPEHDRLRDLAGGDERIEFVGYVDGAAKAALLAGASALVVPSRYEPWGLVVNEALAYGTPVVCSDVVAARVLVNEANGIVFADGDEAALSAALARVLDPAQVELLRAGARATPAGRLSDPRTGTAHFRAAIDFVLEARRR